MSEPDDMKRAFSRADEARAAIAQVVADVRSADIDLPAAFARADRDPLVARCFAVKVLEAVPGIGKVRARRTMAKIGLADDVALGSVPPADRAAIVAAFSEPV